MAYVGMHNREIPVNKTSVNFALAVQDLVEGMRLWRVWYVLGLSEIRQRYRRSTLGPLWLSLSVGIQAFVMGFLLSFLFQTDINRQLPYICISLVVWTFIQGAINEGATCFITLASTILQVRRPLWTYISLTLWRNVIIFLHTIIVFVVAAMAFKVIPTGTYVYIPLGLALLLLNIGWMTLVAALVSTRFRDVPLLIGNLFSILIWLTPVYYTVDQLAPKMRAVIELNPLTHVLEVARSPFLNQMPSLSVWLTATAVAIFGWLMALAIFARTRARVPYWV